MSGTNPGGDGPGCTHRAVRARFTLSQIFARFGALFRRRHGVSPQQARVMGAISKCRTSALGGHIYSCSHCDYVIPAYNSCRDRHCPNCQGAAQYRWIKAQEDRILNTHYFHVVFTLPAELRQLAAKNPKVIYPLLMRSSAQALISMGNDPKRLGALIGVTAVLHTWSRTLAYHPHVHCIVTGGGLSPADQGWRATHRRMLFPLRPLQALFRGKFLAGLRAEEKAGRITLSSSGSCGSSLVSAMYQVRWHVYAKAPFGGPAQVFRYLGAYTHRVGLANSRIREVTEAGITFTTRGEHTTKLKPAEFIRRFLMHVLPRGFVKIRHFGLLASIHARTKHAQAASCLGVVHASMPTPRDAEHPLDEGADDDSSLTSALSGRIIIELAAGRVIRCPRCGVGVLRIQEGGLDPPM